MQQVARIVLALDEHDVAEEVMHFLDRTGGARIVGTAGDQRQLADAVRQLEPDAVVGSPALLRDGVTNGSAMLAVDTRETVGSLRAAIRAGADGYFLWPEDRDELAEAAARARPASEEIAGEQRATVVGLYGPRGGSGTTFLATHLAAAFARRERSCVLVDADPLFGDVAAAIGVPLDPPARTIGDLIPLMDELSPEHLEEALWRHDEGFRALLAPEPEQAIALGEREYRACVHALARCNDVVLAHLPRSLGGPARGSLHGADRVLVVLTLDVLSFRDAKRALRVLAELGFEGRCDFVVNRAARSEITPRDVERAFGCAPLAVIAADAGVSAAQDRGRLLGRRGRAARAIDALASALLEEVG